jgi:hypothetical protein
MAGKTIIGKFILTNSLPGPHPSQGNAPAFDDPAPPGMHGGPPDPTPILDPPAPVVHTLEPAGVVPIASEVALEPPGPGIDPVAHAMEPEAPVRHGLPIPEGERPVAVPGPVPHDLEPAGPGIVPEASVLDPEAVLPPPRPGELAPEALVPGPVPVGIEPEAVLPPPPSVAVEGEGEGPIARPIDPEPEGIGPVPSPFVLEQESVLPLPPSLSLEPEAPGPVAEERSLEPEGVGPTAEERVLEPEGPGPSPEELSLEPEAAGPSTEKVELETQGPGPSAEEISFDPEGPGPTAEKVPLEPEAPGPVPIELSLPPEGPGPVPEELALPPEGPGPAPEEVPLPPEGPGPIPAELALPPEGPGPAAEELALEPEGPGPAPEKIDPPPEGEGLVPEKLDLAPEGPGIDPTKVDLEPEAAVSHGGGPGLATAGDVPDPRDQLRDYIRDTAGARRSEDPVDPPLQSPFRNQGLMDALRLVDRTLVEDLENFDERRDPAWPGVLGSPGAQALDPVLFARNVARMGASLGAGGLATFAAEQVALWLLNRPPGIIWNPLLLANPPIVQNFVPPALDLLFPGGVGDRDRHRDFVEGKLNEFQITASPPFVQVQTDVGSSGLHHLVTDVLGGRIVGDPSQDQALVDNIYLPSLKPIVDQSLELKNTNHPERPWSEFAPYNVGDLVDEVLEGRPAPGRAPILEQDPSGETTHKRWPEGEGIARLFYQKPSDGPISQEWRPNPGISDLPTDFASRPAAVSSFHRGIIPAAFPGENDQAFVWTRKGESPSDIVDDDDAHVPFSITDLRPVGGYYRTVFFRPLNLRVRRGTRPEWAQQTYFGRSDPVATYKGTARSLSVSWEMHAFGPEDLEVIYAKLHWLDSMCFPEYDSGMNMVAGPVVRVRVGDVVDGLGTDGGRGQVGLITGKDEDFENALWELKRGFKVPRMVKVGLELVVLHDRPVGRGALGKFGGLGTFDTAPGREGRWKPPQAVRISSDPSREYPEVSGDGHQTINPFAGGFANLYDETSFRGGRSG